MTSFLAFPLLIFLSTALFSFSQDPPEIVKRELRHLKKRRYEVTGQKGDRPGYIKIQDAIEAARAEGASSARPATVIVDPGKYEENLILYDGIEIEGPDGEPLFAENNQDLSVEIKGTYKLPQDGSVVLKNLTFQIIPENTDSQSQISIKKNDPKSLIVPPTVRTNPANTNSGGSTVSVTPNAVLIGTPSGGIGSLPAASDLQLIVGQTGMAPELSTLTEGVGISISNMGGLLTISNTNPGGSLQFNTDGAPANPAGGMITISGGSTGLTTNGSMSTVSLGGVLNPGNGGTGVANSNTLAWSGGLGIFTFQNPNSTVTFPTSGTLATTTQLPTPAALTEVDDTNVTLTLGGTPNTALLQATSITAGWTGQLAPSRGGTGVANMDANTLAWSGGLGIFTFQNPNSTVTFPTSGTLATTTQLPTPAALTEVDDTNVTLTLGGTPNTALLQATSITAGWTGQLAPSRGGTGVANMDANTLAWSGGLGIFTFQNPNSTVTFPTSGTLATTTQLPTPAALTEVDDTNVTLTLGGTPNTALLQATSITAGWTGQLAPSRGGTGVANMDANTLAWSGGLGIFTFQSPNSTVTFPASGTLATTADLPTPAALTRTNDTNVTLTLGGTPNTALLQATSITAGWTGQLAPSRGGTGVANMDANTLAWSGGLGIFTFQSPNSTVTFPASGTLATTADLPTPAALTRTNDTNVTLTLGGTPNTALLQATSITAGWTGQLAPSRGGTGVANMDANTLAWSGGLGIFTFQSPNSTVTFPTSGTLATTTQLPTPAALTRTNDTNVTLTLGGTPNTALLQATSITAGWTGQLAPSRGGTGVANMDANTLAWSGGLGIFTFQNPNSTVTFPSSGTLATTTQLPTPAALTRTNDTNVTLTLGGTPNTALLQATSITAGWSGQLSMARGGTGANLSPTNGSIVYTDNSAMAIGPIGLNGQVLQSTNMGAGSPPAFSSATYPSVATVAGKILRADGTNWAQSTATYPNTTTSQQILYSTSANTIGELTTAASRLPATNAAGTLAMRSFSINVQVFTASGTYTPSTGMLYCTVLMCGGGGGGGGVATTTAAQVAAAAGGSGAESAYGVFSAATIGASQTVTIGAAGTAGAAGNNTGGTGGTTSLGVLMTAVGGVGGGGGAATTTGYISGSPTGGNGGTGGSYRAQGSSGGSAIAQVSPLLLQGGQGGAAMMFGGGAGTTGGTFGFGATTSGGGGSGASSSVSQAAQAGGPGAAGKVVITEYIIN